jgi:uncharacterized protein with HEPN domain
MSSDDLLYLQNILDAAMKVEEYLKGIDRDAFLKTSLVQDGVIRQIMIMGEATQLLSDALREKYPKVPWRSIARMRDMLIHRYFSVNLEEVWLTAQNDLPDLKAHVAKMIEDIQAEDTEENDER